MQLEPDIKHDLDSVLSIALIRQHTKTDDDPGVSDELLKLYRQASIEAAELYTQRVWGAMRTVSQAVKSFPVGQRKKFASIDLDMPTIDGVVALHGDSLNVPLRIEAEPNATRIKVPYFDELVEGCCRPCGDAINYGMKAVYRTGIKCAEDLPMGIILGCLKYIAWTIGNPGDTLITMANSKQVSSDGVGGTNNAAWASGAIEQWRMYRSKVAS